MRVLTTLPDLTLIHVQECCSLDGIQTFQLGSKPYRVTVSADETHDNCECPGKKFHGTCKHVAEARSKCCWWSSMYSEEAQTPQQQMEMRCPKCGGDTRFQGYGV